MQSAHKKSLNSFQSITPLLLSQLASMHNAEWVCCNQLANELDKMPGKQVARPATSENSSEVVSVPNTALAASPREVHLEHCCRHVFWQQSAQLIVEFEEHNHAERGGGLWGKALNLSNNNEQTTISLHSRWKGWC